LQHCDPRSANDGELAQICATTPLENMLQAGGCLGSFVLLILLFVSPLADLFLPTIIGTALVMAALFAGLHAAGRSRRAYREELAWRRGRAPFGEYVEEARKALDWSGADWIILFARAGLPHGDYQWLRLTVTEERPARIYASLRISKSDMPDRRADGNLPDGALQDLLGMLQGLELPALTDVPATVMDGAPCRVAIVRREPEGVARGSCNLGGLTDEDRLVPTVAVCLKLAGIAGSFASAPDGAS
jgi:hypothetical protein